VPPPPAWALRYRAIDYSKAVYFQEPPSHISLRCLLALIPVFNFETILQKGEKFDSTSSRISKATKSIELNYISSEGLSFLFEDFRLMCNDAIRIALQEKPRNRVKLQELAYRRLREYGLHTRYI
jgi:hypothetical protein